MYTNYAIISLSNYERVFNRKIVIGFLYATAQTFFFFTINTQKCCVQSLVSCYSTDWFRKTLYGCLQLFNKLFSLEFHIQLFSIFYQTMVFTTKLYYVLQYISFSLFIGKISKNKHFVWMIITVFPFRGGGGKKTISSSKLLLNGLKMIYFLLDIFNSNRRKTQFLMSGICGILIRWNIYNN